MDKNTRYSFIDLIQKYNIEIPLIQRDYAQGRESAKELRNNFLLTLFNYLNSYQEGDVNDLDFYT